MAEQEMKLTTLLEQHPDRFEPVTALRIAQQSGEEVDFTAPIGVSVSIFPVEAVERQDGRLQIRSSLAAISGPTGSLPPIFNDLAMREARNRARAFSAFIDLFNERIAVLFVAASEKYRMARQLRWRKLTDNQFVKTLLSLTGFGTAELIEYSRVKQDVVLRYSGFLASRLRNNVNLSALLADFSGLPITIEQFRPRWLTVSSDEQTQPGIANNRLGIDCMAGNSILDRSSSFRIVIGPVGYDDYMSLRPDGRRIKEIYAISRLYVGDGLNFDLQIILKKEDIPFAQLGNGTVRLSWNSWARVADADKDSRDAIIIPRPEMLEDPS